MFDTAELPACLSVELFPSTYSAAVPDDDAFRAMKSRLDGLLPRLNERDRRLALATEAKSWGRGGIAAVHRATGASRSTIRRGLAELDNDQVGAGGPCAGPGWWPQESRGGRPGTAGQSGFSHRAGDPRGSRVAVAVDHEVDPATWPASSPRWDTPSATRWSRRSCARPGSACRAPARPSKAPSTPTGTPSSATSTPWPAQFLAAGEPVISVDTKKKELVGRFAQAGREWQPSGDPERRLMLVVPVAARRGSAHEGLPGRGCGAVDDHCNGARTGVLMILDVDGGEDGVEGGGELAVAVAGAGRSSRSMGRLRACWVNLAPVGWAVTPRMGTRRVDELAVPAQDGGRGDQRRRAG